MGQNFELKAVISATNHLSPVLKDIQRSIAGVSKSLASIKQALGNVSVATLPLLAVGGAATMLGKSMLDTTAEFEKYSLVLETLEGSQQKAKASMGWISDFAAKTPYELSQVTDAFVKLKSYGIDPVQGQTLRVLGDTAAAMGKDLNGAVEALADAVTGENERLKEFGITAKKSGNAILYSFTDKQGKQRIAKARADSREQIRLTLMGIWNEKYGGAMDKLSGSWTGMISNLKDQFARFSLMVMESGAFKWLKEQLGGVLKTIDRLQNSFADTAANKGMQAVFGPHAVNGVVHMQSKLEEIAETVGTQLLDALKQIAQAMKDMAEVVVWLKDAFGGWGNLLKATVVILAGPLILSVVQFGIAMGGLTKAILLNAVTTKAAGAAWAWMRGQAAASMLAMSLRAPGAVAAVSNVGSAAVGLAGTLGTLAAVAAAAFIGWKVGELANEWINSEIKARTGKGSLGEWAYDKIHGDEPMTVTLAEVNAVRRKDGKAEWSQEEWAWRQGGKKGPRPDLIAATKPAKVEGAIKVEFANAPPGMRIAQEKQAGGVSINPSVGYRPQILTGG